MEKAQRDNGGELPQQDQDELMAARMQAKEMARVKKIEQ